MSTVRLQHDFRQLHQAILFAMKDSELAQRIECSDKRKRMVHLGPGQTRLCTCAKSGRLPKCVSVFFIGKLQAVTNFKPALVVLWRIEVLVSHPSSPHFSYSISYLKIVVVNAQVISLLAKRVLESHDKPRR